jgi:hypothetical protein
MSDNSIELSQAEERRQARLQAQSEWRRSNTLLCDCNNCINSRELNKETDVKESARLPPAPALPKQPDISQLKIPDIRSLFRFLLPSDEDIVSNI